VEQTECSETSAYKIQTPENYTEESVQLPLTCSTRTLHRSLFFPRRIHSTSSSPTFYFNTNFKNI